MGWEYRAQRLAIRCTRKLHWNTEPPAIELAVPEEPHKPAVHPHLDVTSNRLQAVQDLKRTGVRLMVQGSGITGSRLSVPRGIMAQNKLLRDCLFEYVWVESSDFRRAHAARRPFSILVERLPARKGFAKLRIHRFGCRFL